MRGHIWRIFNLRIEVRLDHEMGPSKSQEHLTHLRLHNTRVLPEVPHNINPIESISRQLKG